MAKTLPSAVVCMSIGLASLTGRDVDAQAPVPVGGEFRVNTYTSGDQYDPVVGMDVDGDFVVVWYGPGDGDYGVFARRYNSSGTALAVQFQVNTYTTNFQRFPAVDVDVDGDFVIAWTSVGQDGDASGIFARRFSSAGAPLTAELLVNVTTANEQTRPSVATDTEGDFVIAWQSNLQDGSSYGIFARRFSSAGTALGGEFRSNSFTANAQRDPAIDLEANGDFVVVWSSLQDGSGYGVFGQRFSSSATPLGPEFQINSGFTNDQESASVGVDSDGDFVVVWTNEVEPLSSYNVLGRRYNSSGAKLSAEFLISSYLGTQSRPRVATDDDGDFVVAWRGQHPDDSSGISMRRFKASGAAQNLDTLVNATTADDQLSPAVATDADGDFVVVWNSFLIDGSGFGVFAQRFSVGAMIDVDGDGQYLPLTDGLLLLRFGFGFTGATLITGAVGAGCTRCDAPSITVYLQGLL